MENRTRTYQSRSFDDQFDRELPQEARTELSRELPLPKTNRKSAPTPPPPKKVINRPPPTKRGRGAAILGAVAIVALSLYAVSSHRGGPSIPTAPPESRSVPTPSSQSVEVRRALPPPSVIEVRRALPAVPRALPVTSQVSPMWNWQPVRMPDGTLVQVSYQGERPSSAALPTRGRFIGEEWSTGNTSWIWMTPAGASFPSWVDP